MNRLFHRSTSLFLALLLTSAPLVSASVALGDDLLKGEIPVASDATYTRETFWSNYYNDYRREQYVVYEPSQNLTPVMYYGDYILNRQNLSTMSNALTNEGFRVVAGINGDFYDTATGNPLGLVISDGILRSTSGGFPAIGFLPDGSAVIDTPAITVTARFLDSTSWITNVNKTRTSPTATTPGGYYLYTSAYSKTTQHSVAGIDVILTPISQTDIPVSGVENTSEGDILDLFIGGRLTCVVEQVFASTGSIDIPDGKLILTISNNNEEDKVALLSSLAVGDEVIIDVACQDATWKNVTTAMGSLYRIVTNGEVGPYTDSSANPRTAVGVRADGSIVLYTIDGRQTGYSIGATMKQVAQRLIELGCVDAIGLDGGGSTTMYGTMPWNDTPELLNSTSESSLRSVTNGLFLVSSLEPTGIPDSLVLTPYTANLLSGASVQMNTTTKDTAFYTMYQEDAILWTVESNGSISSSGVFTAGDTLGLSRVVATAEPSGITGSTEVNVVATPTAITPHLQSDGSTISRLTLEPNQIIDLTASASYRGLPLTAEDSCFTWTAEPWIGTIDEHGVFTAGTFTTNGSIRITAGDFTTTVPVSVTGSTTLRESFESDPSQFNLLGTDTISLMPTTSASSVALGKQSVALTYSTGDAPATAISTLPLSSTDTWLSAWVKGDGTNNELVATVLDATGNTTSVTLGTLLSTDWQRLTAEIPAGSVALSSIQIIGLDDITSGTFWLDHITSANEPINDTVAPSIALSVANSMLTATLSDDVDKEFNLITLTMDGKALAYTMNSAGTTLTASLPTADENLHRVTLTVTDQSGNIAQGSYDIVPVPSETLDDEVSASPFLDMDTHWANSFTTYLYDQNIVTGMATDTGFLFQPDNDITRGDFALMVARWMDLDLTQYADIVLPFADVADIPSWSLNAVKAMYHLELMQGSLNGGALYAYATSTITRAEAMTLLGRIQPKGYETAPLTFSDTSDVPAWALPYVETLVKQGIISGYDNQLNPNNSVKRGEMAKMLYALT